ncbi:MAG: hypothetical protein LM550_16315 [Candidatus Contendobacter sp.]|jgi:hypothetical protein|nr:hypothetical protein [Gammaproteobacteria bacterium]MCC8995211.1 hypothetical protein [Candidatus Contendobacter sp.]
MSNKTNPATDLAAVIKSLKGYLLEKGHRFERGPIYEGQSKTSSNVAETAKGYEARGYAKYMQVGDPPVYAMLGRGHEEVHIFQPQDPQVREWLEDDRTALNDPTVRAHLLQGAGLSETDLPVATRPQVFRITEVNDVFIITSEDDPRAR